MPVIIDMRYHCEQKTQGYSEQGMEEEKGTRDQEYVRHRAREEERQGCESSASMLLANNPFVKMTRRDSIFT